MTPRQFAKIALSFPETVEGEHMKELQLGKLLPKGIEEPQKAKPELNAK